MVRPGPPLSGSVRVGGAKNSALKLMAACLLAEGRHTLYNVPRISDVQTMSELLTALGVSVRWREDNVLVIDTPREPRLEAPYEQVERMRASIVVLGPLLAKNGFARVPMPGGDDFGPRPIDMHVRGLESMGAAFKTSHGYVEGTADQLSGDRVVLEFPSHTATDNLLMAAVLAKGRTVIENAAREPEISDLAAFLRRMGARIEGAGTSRIEVEGREELSPTEHTVIPDRVEAATFLAAVGIAGGEVVVEEARFEHMDMLIAKLGEMGLRISPASDGLWVSARGWPHSVDVATLPYPGVATDYKPFLVTMLTLADGVSIVSENLFFGRFRYVDELRRMSADIRTEGHHAVIRGVPRLSGAVVRAPDVRGRRGPGARRARCRRRDGCGRRLPRRPWLRDVCGQAGVPRSRCVQKQVTAGSGKRRSPASTSTSASRRSAAGASQLLEAATNGDRSALARLVSMVERGGLSAREVGRLSFPNAGGAHTVGITGAPGSGKSTLTDQLIVALRKDARRVGVLAIDPTSPFSGGAILGDRIRMQGHAMDDGVFIRSMATRGHLGGLALAVPETMRLLDATGMEVILVETVGVGQAEVEVAEATDTTVVVVNPGWGDAVQANKAGLLEIGDVFVVNKADRPGVNEARRELDMMLDMSNLGEWRPPIIATVASRGEGVPELWSEISRHRSYLSQDDRIAERRAERLARELHRVIAHRLGQRADELLGSPGFDELRRAVESRQIDPYEAADEVLGRLT